MGVSPATGAPPIEHRFLGLDKRNIPGTLIVVAVWMLWAVVMPAINELVDADEIEPGTTLQAGRGIEFTPTPGWVIEGSAGANDLQGDVEIVRDGMTFHIRTGEFSGTPDELLTQLLDLNDAFKVEGERRPVTLPSGIVGTVIQIFEQDSSGDLFAFTVEGDSTGIEVEVEGPPETLARYTDEIGEMIGSIRPTDAGEGQ